MPAFSLTGHNVSKKILLLTGAVFIVILAGVLALTYGIGQRAQTRMLQNQELTYSPPTTPAKRVIKKIRARRLNAAGEIETVEISENGQVCVFNADGSLQKCSNQGFGRTQSFFNNINKLLDGWQTGFSLGGRYLDITVTTNLGETTITLNSGGSPGGSGIDHIIDDLDNYVDDTFAPTPTLIPTATQSPHPPTATPTSSAPPVPTPTTWVPSFPGEPSPTPVPEYMLYPPFKCEDYHFSGPFTISNIMCNTE